MEIAARVKARRKEKKFTQKELRRELSEYL